MRFKCRVEAPGGLRVILCLPVLLLITALAGCGKPANEASESVAASELTRNERNLPSVSAEPSAFQTAVPANEAVKEISSEDFFKQGVIPCFRIQASENCLDQLESQPRTFVQVDVQVDGVLYRDVGMHLKGRRGSFRPLESKPGLTLKFNKFRKRQRFHGLEKVHLSNEVQDPSFMNEILCSQITRAALSTCRRPKSKFLSVQYQYQLSVSVTNCWMPRR